jgi:hypothetical protein
MGDVVDMKQVQRDLAKIERYARIVSGEENPIYLVSFNDNPEKRRPMIFVVLVALSIWTLIFLLLWGIK